MSMLQSLERTVVNSGSVSPEMAAEDGGGEQEQPMDGVEQDLVIGPWQITMRWSSAVTGGPTEMTIKPAPATSSDATTRGITVSTLRAIPLTQLSREARAISSAVSRAQGGDALAEAIVCMAQKIGREVQENPRPGRAGRPDEFFALVAAVYSWYVDSGYSDPVRQLADACDCKWRVAANWVRLAREKDLLAPAVERRAGGLLTERALRILESGDDGIGHAPTVAPEPSVAPPPPAPSASPAGGNRHG
ncbi:hypothetical protein [Actinomadura violacea]|uniref:Uncharacterized protein n=1 Tax=Actinomadura violacea TaxID=2819934 RepID=A0ABS3RIR5_9ACTN|nr:hypothetical protein [Actinomadura violacea]MBO2455980.1 hypothetical protein [Actinomadura violacea]